MPTRRVVGSPLAGRRQQKPERSRLYHTKAWEAASQRFLAEHIWCAECRRSGRFEPATQTDHIVPHKGNVEAFWDSTNWQPLCDSCHGRKSARE